MDLVKGLRNLGECPDGGVGGYRERKWRQDMVEGIW